MPYEALASISRLVNEGVVNSWKTNPMLLNVLLAGPPMRRQTDKFCNLASNTGVMVVASVGHLGVPR